MLWVGWEAWLACPPVWLPGPALHRGFWILAGGGGPERVAAELQGSPGLQVSVGSQVRRVGVQVTPGLFPTHQVLERVQTHWQEEPVLGSG